MGYGRGQVGMGGGRWDMGGAGGVWEGAGGVWEGTALGVEHEKGSGRCVAWEEIGVCDTPHMQTHICTHTGTHTDTHIRTHTSILSLFLNLSVGMCKSLTVVNMTLYGRCHTLYGRRWGHKGPAACYGLIGLQ